MRLPILRLLLLVAVCACHAAEDETPPAGSLSRSARTADAVLADTFTLQDVTARQPRLADGGLDWEWRGPRDDPEWAWLFNRHYFMDTLCSAWRETGDQRYADYLFAALDDWIIKHPAPGRMSFSAAWRPLEAARRILGPWKQVYSHMQENPAFTPERQARFLDSVRAHGEQLRNHHALAGNHLITEMLALAHIALLFPHDAQSDEWLAYGLGRLAQNYESQVYPDGSYKELSSHYQRVVAVNYQDLLDLLAGAGRDAELALWRPRVDRLWAYLRAVQKPGGGTPANNDSDEENIRALLQAKVPRLAVPPKGTVALPYAGQIVFRSGAGDGAEWAFFDRGPRGTAHQHDDLLHFSLSIGKRDMLVDNGRYTYKPGAWRDYFAGASGHNVLLVDGRGAEQGPDEISAGETPRSSLTVGDHWESAVGNAVFGPGRAADWRRCVVNLHGVGWIVLDRIVSFAPHELQTLWHWHPDCDVRTDHVETLTVRNHEATLQVAFSSTTAAGFTQAAGQIAPPQGWHSDQFNRRQPATCGIATQRVTRPTWNAWLFTKERSPINILLLTAEPESVRLRITVQGSTRDVLIRITSDGASLETIAP